MEKLNSKQIAVIAFFGALSGLLMFFDFPIPIAPAFMKMDLSDLPIIIGGFLLGSIQGIVIAAIKIVIKIVMKPTSTMFLGELANFIGSIVYVVPASLIYVKLKNKKRAIIGLVVGSILSSVACTLCNLLFLFPLYMNMFHMSEETIIGMCSTINPHIDSMAKVMILSVFPFNLIKYLTTSVITYIFYKNVSKAIKGLIQ